MASISYYLGYSSDDYEPIIPQSRRTLVDGIKDQLDAIDTALANAAQDSMAVKLGDTQVDYAQHLSVLKSEGSRLVQLLSAQSGLAIKYDRYLGVMPDNGRSSLSVLNYW